MRNYCSKASLNATATSVGALSIIVITVFVGVLKRNSDLFIYLSNSELKIVRSFVLQCTETNSTRVFKNGGCPPGEARL